MDLAIKNSNESCTFAVLALSRLGILHCWKILSILLVTGLMRKLLCNLCKVASIGFYSPFYIAKWRVLGFTRHFTLYCMVLLTILHVLLCLASIWWLFVWLYFSTMHILWDRQSQYDVLLIIHATKVLKSLVYDSWISTVHILFLLMRGFFFIFSWAGTKCIPIFGLTQKIWTSPKYFETCIRHKSVLFGSK